MTDEELNERAEAAWKTEYPRKESERLKNEKRGYRTDTHNADDVQEVFCEAFRLGYRAHASEQSKEAAELIATIGETLRVERYRDDGPTMVAFRKLAALLGVKS